MSIDVNVQNDLVVVTESSEDITVNVSNAAGPAGPGVPVGGSTGQVLKKLSNTNYDTYWALDAGGVPYSGATGDVDLGEYELKAGQVEFDQTPTGTAGVGVLRWNDTDGTLDLGLKGGNVTLQIGQEQVQRVVNKSGVNLLESAYQVVKVTDAQGQRLSVDLAQGNNDLNSADTIGIVTENIDNNQEGFICTSGLVRNINTTGSLQGETWADGDVLYLSPTTAGQITNIKPTAPNHTVVLGYVVYAHANNGKIFVKCDNGYEIGELHDCYLPTPSNNDGIFWSSANSRYQNNTIAGALGYTPVPTTRTLTINGTAYDLSADRSWTVSAANIYTADGTLTGNRTVSLGGYKLSLGTPTTGFVSGAFEIGTNTSTGASQVILNSNVSGRGSIFFGSVSRYMEIGVAGTSLAFPVNGGAFIHNPYANLYFTGGAGSQPGAGDVIMSLFQSTKNITVGGITDSGYKIDVQGTARVSGASSGSSGYSLVVTDTNSTNGATLSLTFSSNNSLLLQSRSTGARLYSSNSKNFLGFNYTSGNVVLCGTEDSYNSDKLNIITTSSTSADGGGATLVDGGFDVGVGAGYNFYSSYASKLLASIRATINSGFNNTGLRFLVGNNSGVITEVFRITETQNVLIGSTTNVPSAILAASSTTKGFLPPRMTNAQRTAISFPAVGLMVYCTDTVEGLYEYKSSGWINLNGEEANRQTASYTLALTDNGKLVEMNVASANNLTVPLNSLIAFPIGTKIDIAQYGAGQTTVVATGGVTIRSAGGALKLAAQYSGGTLVKIATDEWYLFGDITV